MHLTKSGGKRRGKLDSQTLKNFLEFLAKCLLTSPHLPTFYQSFLDLIILAMKPKLALYPANLDGRRRHGHEIEMFTGTVEEEVQKIAFEVKSRLQVEKIEVASL